MFIFFGLVAVVGTAYLQAGRLEPLFVVAAIPVGALTTAILVVNNLRDIPTDTAAGKRTLAVMLGVRRDAASNTPASCCVAFVVPVVLGRDRPRAAGPAAAPRAAARVAAAADGPDVRRAAPAQPGPQGRPPGWRSSYGLLFAVGLALGGAVA